MLQIEVATPVLSGDILAGKYRIERLLGEGAMGTVMAARHLLLELSVAIKFLRPELAQEPDIAERFRREAKAAARVKGEHVVRVFDVGELESGLPYLVMEYVEGMNLAEVIAAEGPLPTAVAVDYILQACDALAQAHAAGVVHRDVKPSNLFVSRRSDDRPLVKVLDFGISKVSGVDGTMTHPTALMGSPLYMSPEQLLSSRDVDGRSDIWSLGIVLYEMLTGAPPFVGDTIPRICAQIQGASPPSLRKLRAEIPEDLETVVLRCLKKDPALRFATIPELVSALRSVAGAVAKRHEDTRDAGAQKSHEDAGAQSGGVAARSAIRDGPGPSRRMLRIVVVGSGLLIVAAATAGLIAFSRADENIVSSPRPSVRVDLPSAPPPAAKERAAAAPVPPPASSLPPPESRDTTAAPHRLGVQAPVTPNARAKVTSKPSQTRTAPRSAPRPVATVPALPADRK